MAVLRTRIVPGAGPGSAHIAGIAEPLPAGERVLWQGAPDWRALAVDALHLRALTLYFGALLALRVASLLAEGKSAAQAAGGTLPPLLLALAALAMLALYAWVVARTSIYAITSARVVLRVGVALPMVVNLPFTGIEAAAVRRRHDGVGDLPLRLRGDAHFAWLHLWPHVRPWQLKHPQPMLRAVPRVDEVAAVLAAALQAVETEAKRDEAFVALAAGPSPAAAGEGSTPSPTAIDTGGATRRVQALCAAHTLEPAS